VEFVEGPVEQIDFESVDVGCASAWPNRADVEQAVRTLIAAAGDDPYREGLRDTPARVARAYGEWFSGYAVDPAQLLRRVFTDAEDYDDTVLLRDIPFVSTCEHHLAPIIGKAAIAYLPGDKVVGISKLARVLHGFARRLQVQERLTDQIADAIMEVLKPSGVGVVIEAAHFCMMMRGVQKQNSRTVTSALRGIFRDDSKTRVEFLRLAHGGNHPE